MLSSKFGLYNKNNPAIHAKIQQEYATLPPSLQKNLNPQYKFYEKIIAKDLSTLKHLTIDEVYVSISQNWRAEMESKMDLCHAALQSKKQIKAGMYYRDAHQILASAEKQFPEQLDDKDLHQLIDYRFNQLVFLYKTTNGRNSPEQYRTTLLTLDRLLNKINSPTTSDDHLKKFVDIALIKVATYSLSKEKLSNRSKTARL